MKSVTRAGSRLSSPGSYDSTNRGEGAATLFGIREGFREEMVLDLSLEG